VMERLGRGVVAISAGEEKVFISWRLLADDPDEIGFNVYRTAGDAFPARLNQSPVTNSTCFTDTGIKLDRQLRYFVRPVVGGKEGAPSASFNLSTNAV